MRSAFLATADETDGVIVFLVSEIPMAPGVILTPGFGFEKAMERSTEVMEGKPFVLRTPDPDVVQLSPEGMTTASNFFLELVELVNMPAGVVHTDSLPSRTFRRRLAKAMGTLDFELHPVTHVTLDVPDLAQRAFGGAA